MAKGFLERLGLVETVQEVRQIEPDTDYDDDVEVDMSQISGESTSFIQEVYDSHTEDLIEQNIFKVEDLVNTLPMEMPDATKKEIGRAHV